MIGTRCEHIHTPVKVGPYTVYTTGSSRIRSKDIRDGTYIPKDLGIHLDIRSWQSLRWVFPVPQYGRGAKVPRLFDEAGREIIYVRWPDFGTIGQDRFLRLIRIVGKALRDGRTVELGCIGAHGRTGTLLAGLLMDIGGLPAGEAIEAVRTRYCERAIENSTQERMLFTFGGEEYVRSKALDAKHTVPVSGRFSTKEPNYSGVIQVWPSLSDEEIVELRDGTTLLPEDQELYMDYEEAEQALRVQQVRCDHCGHQRMAHVTGCAMKQCQCSFFREPEDLEAVGLEETDRDWWAAMSASDRQWWRDFVKAERGEE